MVAARARAASSTSPASPRILPLCRVVAYSAAKAAVLNLTQFLAREWAPRGVRVNSITPGFFPAEQNRRLLFNEDGTPTPRAQSILGHTPMARFGEAPELVGAADFPGQRPRERLSSPASTCAWTAASCRRRSEHAMTTDSFLRRGRRRAVPSRPSRCAEIVAQACPADGLPAAKKSCSSCRMPRAPRRSVCCSRPCTSRSAPVTAAFDVMIALGTHPPMSEEAICARLEISAEERDGEYAARPIAQPRVGQSRRAANASARSPRRKSAR